MRECSISFRPILTAQLTFGFIRKRLSSNYAFFLVVHNLDTLRVERLLQFGEVYICDFSST